MTDFFQPLNEINSIFFILGSFCPQATQSQSGEGKVHVTWAKFEKTDINDPVFFSEQMEINGTLTALTFCLLLISQLCS